MMIERVVVLGAGSAGLMAALTLRVKHPHLKVQILRSPDIGIIGVGEGTTRAFLTFLHAFLKIDVAEFYREVNPMWKLGVRFHWGPRPYFNFTFNNQFDRKTNGLSRPNGFYAGENCEHSELSSALMTHHRIFVRQPDGSPMIRHDLGYHLENATFVNYLERLAQAVKIEFIDGTVRDVAVDEAGVSALQLEDGRSVQADLYVDCSGFRSELLGKALAEPFDDYRSALFCDRAVVGGWDRQAGEPIKPYTTAETMSAGWSWQIEHEQRVNRGYVYSSSFIEDDAAEQEFRERNPRIGDTRVVRFRTGRYRRPWVKNVLALGNAAGFVEPLEATALAVIGEDCMAFSQSLTECNYSPGPAMQHEYNDRGRRIWESIRNFLAVHYRFNTRMETPFWKHCREHVALGAAERIVEYYRENGPGLAYRELLVDAFDQFRLDGYLVMLVGQQVPHRSTYRPSAEEWQQWRNSQAEMNELGRLGLSVEQALQLVRSPMWNWTPNFYELTSP